MKIFFSFSFIIIIFVITRKSTNAELNHHNDHLPCWTETVNFTNIFQRHLLALSKVEECFGGWCAIQCKTDSAVSVHSDLSFQYQNPISSNVGQGSSYKLVADTSNHSLFNTSSTSNYCHIIILGWENHKYVRPDLWWNV